MSVTRHVYNNSNDIWYIAIAGGLLPDVPGGALPGDGFTYGSIPAKSVITIVYKYMAGHITLQQPGQPAGSWPWDVGGIPPNNPFIRHQGPTSGVALNDPVNGDVKLFGV